MCEDCNIICAAVPTSLKDFDSCMRKDCNAFISLLSPSTSDFDSCMRENCNGSQGLFPVLLLYFDSCMREDCNATGCSIMVGWRNFNSCMREDCNVIDQDEAPMVRISIHACARIATVKPSAACSNLGHLFQFMHVRGLQPSGSVLVRASGTF